MMTFKKNLPIIILLGALVIFIFPLTGHTAIGTGGDLVNKPTVTTFSISSTLDSVFNPLWQFAAGLAIIMFVVAGILFITSNGEPGKITTAKNALIWGAVGVLVSVIAFSLVQIISSWVH